MRRNKYIKENLMVKLCVCYICVAMTADKHSEEAASGAGSGGDVSCSDELCSDIFFITKVDRGGEVCSCLFVTRMNTLKLSDG